MKYLTAKTIAEIIYDSIHSGEIRLQNFYYKGFEADLFRLQNNGYIIEYEIKVSRSDFFKDFEKKDKHEQIKSGQRCNRFYFVVPTCLVKIAEVPDYCGLIYVNEHGKTSKIKRAKLLTNEKVSESFYKDLAVKLFYRLHGAKLELKKLKKPKQIKLF